MICFLLLTTGRGKLRFNIWMIRERRKIEKIMTKEIAYDYYLSWNKSAILKDSPESLQHNKKYIFCFCAFSFPSSLPNILSQSIIGMSLCFYLSFVMMNQFENYWSLILVAKNPTYSLGNKTRQPNDILKEWWEISRENAIIAWIFRNI